MFLVSCGGEECITCSGEDPFFGLSFSQEACDNEDGTITVSGTALGITADTTYTSTIEAFRQENEAAGFSCN